MPRLWLIFDATNLAHQMFFAIKNPMLVKDRPTNAIYGFLKMVVMLKERYSADHLAFCFDSASSYRKKILPGYQDRPEKKPENRWQDKVYLRRQISDLKNVVLPSIGLRNILSADGYEADDFAAAVCQHWLVKRSIIVSSDKDLYQCLEDSRHRTVTQYNVGIKQEVTADSFQKKYGIPPSRWPLVKAIAGCVSDKIPGVDGVGEKTAINYLTGKLKAESAACKRIEDSVALIERNEMLVTLPYVGLKTPDLREDEDTDDSWEDMLSEYKVRGLVR